MKYSIYIRRAFLQPALILACIMVISCKTTQQAADYKDLSYLYNPTKTSINALYSVVNESDESSVLSIEFPVNDLFFSEANPQGVSAAMMFVYIKLFNMQKVRVLADTVSLSLNIPHETGKRAYIFDVPLKVEKGNQYLVEIKIADRLRQLTGQFFVQFNTNSVNNSYNFKLQNHFDKDQVFSHVLRRDEYVNLVYQRNQVDSLYISYYMPFKEVPDPPSMLLPEKVLDYEPRQVVALHYSDTLPMMFPNEGIYLCSIDKNNKEGFTFLNLGPTYPRITTPDVMIEPLIYLANQDELASLRLAEKPKAALDEFWIKCGGNVDKARELIRIYYTRVLYANHYFTSYKEGWRSERGMIYIIYGPPDKIYKTADGESWGYKKPSVKSRWGGRFKVADSYLYFTFRKRENIFSDNDFYLSRSETLVTYWDKAVLSWRKGIVFRLDNPKDF